MTDYIQLQVLSTTTAEGLRVYGGEEMVETERFVRMFDKFFDCLNVRSPDEHQRRLKPNLKPYTRSDDERLTVSGSLYSFCFKLLAY